MSLHDFNQFGLLLSLLILIMMVGWKVDVESPTRICECNHKQGVHETSVGTGGRCRERECNCLKFMEKK